jgi:hypothetical protein
MADARGNDEYELPDGVIPLRPEGDRSERAGCRVTGCLYGVVVLFAIALLALVVGLLVRMWITPAVPRI